MSTRVRTTTSPRRHGHHHDAEPENLTPRRSTRPYDYPTAVSPGRHAEAGAPVGKDKVRGSSALRTRRDRPQSPPLPSNPEQNGHYPGDDILRRQSTQRPGGRRSSIDPDQYRRPSPVRHRTSQQPPTAPGRARTPERSPRREREAAAGAEARPSSTRRRHHGESSAEVRPSSRSHRSRSRPDSAVRSPRRAERAAPAPPPQETSSPHRHASRHRSRSRNKPRDESRHRSRSRREDDARRDAGVAQRPPQPTARQDTGRYISPPDPRGHGAAGAGAGAARGTATNTTSSSARRSARRQEERGSSYHHTDPTATSSSSRPPAPRQNGSRALMPPSLSSPQRQRSGSHIEVLSVSSLHGPSYASMVGGSSDVYLNTPLAARTQRPNGGRPYISPSPNQPSSIIEDRIEETKEWVAALRQQVARDRAAERADAALAAADVDRFLAELRRTESITAPSEMAEPQRLYWGSGREAAKPSGRSGFREAPRGADATPDKRHHSTRRRDRDAAPSSSRAESREEAAAAPPTRSRSSRKEHGSAKKPSTRDRDRDRDSERERERDERPRHSSTRRRREAEAEPVPPPLDEELTPGRATSTHPPPPGVPASRTASQAAWQTAPQPERRQEYVDDMGVVESPASTSVRATPATPADRPVEAASSKPSREHTRQSSQHQQNAPALQEPAKPAPSPPTPDPREERRAAKKPKKAAKSKSKPKPPPTPSDVATTASEEALLSESSPAPKEVAQQQQQQREDNGAAQAPTAAEEDGEPDDMFISFLDGTRFPNTDELCEYNVFLAESLSDVNLALVREVVFGNDEVAFAELLYGDEVKGEVDQIELIVREAAAAANDARSQADIEDEIWEEKRAAVKLFNSKATVALESVQSCGIDLVEALETATVAYREEQRRKKREEGGEDEADDISSHQSL